MRRVCVTMFGDYELQATLYGLSGSSGLHPCLHCTITKAEKQKPAGNRSKTAEKRTLESLASDYQAFQDAGAVLANAKKFHDVIWPAILPIPVEEVCIPALHLDLGIFPYLYYAFVHELRRVDLHMAEKMSTSADDGEVFRQAAASFEAVVQMERRLTAAKEEANATAAQVRKWTLMCCTNAQDRSIFNRFISTTERLVQNNMQTFTHIFTTPSVKIVMERT